MTTTAQHLASLSGLPPGSAARAHLVQVAGAAGQAGALLVLRSGLPTGTALQHLLAIHLVDFVSAPAGAGYVRAVPHTARYQAAATHRSAMADVNRPEGAPSVRAGMASTTRAPPAPTTRPQAAPTGRPGQRNTTR